MRDDFLPRMFPERWYNGQAIGEQGWTGVLEIRGLRAVGEIFLRQAPAAPPRPVRAAPPLMDLRAGRARTCV